MIGFKGTVVLLLNVFELFESKVRPTEAGLGIEVVGSVGAAFVGVPNVAPGIGTAGAVYDGAHVEHDGAGAA